MPRFPLNTLGCGDRASQPLFLEPGWSGIRVFGTDGREAQILFYYKVELAIASACAVLEIGAPPSVALAVLSEALKGLEVGAEPARAVALAGDATRLLETGADGEAELRQIAQFPDVLLEVNMDATAELDPGPEAERKVDVAPDATKPLPQKPEAEKVVEVGGEAEKAVDIGECE